MINIPYSQTIFRSIKHYTNSSNLVLVIYSSIGIISLLETLDEENLTDWQILLSLFAATITLFLVKVVSYFIGYKSFSHVKSLTSLFVPLFLPACLYFFFTHSLTPQHEIILYLEESVFFTMFVFTSLTYAKNDQYFKSIAMGLFSTFSLYAYSFILDILQKT